jgi:hypothetical protein
MCLPLAHFIPIYYLIERKVKDREGEGGKND